MYRIFISVTGLLLLLATNSCKHLKPSGKEVAPPFSGVDTAQVDMVLAGMSLEEKIGQLILWEAPAQDSSERQKLFQKVTSGQVGGVLLSNVHIADYMYSTDSLKRGTKIPLFFASDQKSSIHNQFKDIQQFPIAPSIAAIDSLELTVFLEKKYVDDCKALGINFVLNPTVKVDEVSEQVFDYQTFESDEVALSQRAERMFKMLNDRRILAIGDAFQKFEFNANDSLRDITLHRYLQPIKLGLGGLMVSNKALNQDTLKELPAAYPKSYLSRYLGFFGLMVVKLDNQEAPEQKLLSGADLVIAKDIDRVALAYERLVTLGKISEKALDQRVRRVLLAKSWVNGGNLPVKLSILPYDSTTHKPVQFVSISEKREPRVVQEHKPRSVNFDSKVDKTVCYFGDPRWGFFIGKLFEQSVILARDEQGVLPFQKIYDTDYQIFKFSQKPFSDFKSLFSKYANFKVINRPVSAAGELEPVVFEKTNGVPAAVILLDSIGLQQGFHRKFIESVNDLASQAQVVVLNFGNPKNLHYFSPSVACVQIFEKNKFTEAYAAQLLFGGVAAEGKLPISVDESLVYGSSVQQKPVRLAFAPAENTGIATERLVGIDAIANSAINNGVFPGCQVAVAKDGQVIYSKSFGHFTYNKTSQPVQNNDLYDVASMTKVAATTLVAMKLVEENQLDLEGKVADYINAPTNSAVGKIKIKQLLLHQSGLQAQMPLSRFFSGKNVPNKGCNDYFCRKRKGGYSVKVANGLFFRQTFQDTILKRVFKLPVSSNPRFRYSDVNFYLLKKVVEAIIKTPMDTYVFKNIYHPLGLRSICFNPLERFPLKSIVPTEQDNYWRKTLVQGYVHDPCVALLGGVGGSAGIFSNAEDLAVLFQMLLEKGQYGGLQFFNNSTIENFSSVQNSTNHRGLGFDKPTKRKYPTYSPKVSPKTYGHTGFTGTCVWVDPENNLVYVFLSNRVNPSSRNGKIFTENIRSRIHDIVYDAFGSFDSSLPTLDNDDEEEIEMEEGAGG